MAHCGPWCRYNALSDRLVAQSTEALSAVSESVGGGPVTILLDNRSENVSLHVAMRKVRSLMSKQDFARVGEEMMRHFEQHGGRSSSKRPLPTDAETKAFMRLGVEVMLAGGVEACMRMGGIQDIKDAAFAMRLSLPPPNLTPSGV